MVNSPNISILQSVDTFFANFKKQQFRKGEILIRADDTPSGIFYIKEGIIRQYYISKKWDEITLNMYKPASFFPISWAIADIPNNYYFEAMNDCIIFKAPKDAVNQFLQNEPLVLYDLMKRVFIGIEGLWLHVEYLTAGKSDVKLIASLVILAKRFGKVENNCIAIQLKMTEKEIGEYAGMYRETVSREFQLLKKKGLLSHIKGKIIITDMKKLENELTL